MRPTSKTNLALALALRLAACDTGTTNLGDLEAETETTADGGDMGCPMGWSLGASVRDGDSTAAYAVLALDDGFVLGATPRSGDVTRVTADGVEQWTVELGEPEQAFIKDVIVDHDGGYVVTVHEPDATHSSGMRVRAVRLSPTGTLQWSTDLGAGHAFARMEADLLLHPEGGTLVSWHDSQDAFLEPRLVLARLDAQGGIEWSVAHPLAINSNTATMFSHGAAALLGDGSILQLTTDGPGLRLVRTAADGSPISDAVLDGIEGSPTDLVVLPDGGVLVLANGAEVMVIEVEPDGSVLSTLGFTRGEYALGDVMAWDPVFSALLVGGWVADPQVPFQHRWTLMLDREGNALFEALVLPEDDTSAGPLVAVDVSSIPSGGFVVSRHVGSLYYETVLPCTED